MRDLRRVAALEDGEHSVDGKAIVDQLGKQQGQAARSGRAERHPEANACGDADFFERFDECFGVVAQIAKDDRHFFRGDAVIQQPSNPVGDLPRLVTRSRRAESANPDMTVAAGGDRAEPGVQRSR